MDDTFFASPHHVNFTTQPDFYGPPKDPTTVKTEGYGTQSVSLHTAAEGVKRGAHLWPVDA